MRNDRTTLSISLTKKGNSFDEKICAITAACAGILGIVGTSQADTAYTSRAAFGAATAAQTIIDFNGIAGASSAVFYGTGPLTLSGVTFTGNRSMFVIGENYYGTAYPDGGYLNSDYAASGTNTIVAALPLGTTAIGFDFGGLLGAPVTFSVTLSDGFTWSGSSNGAISPLAPLEFIGFTSSTPLTSITIDMPDAPRYNSIDNFTIASAVPEPVSCALVITGLGLLGATLRRRETVSSPAGR